MQIYILITVSLICISLFDLNVDVTILYSCPHICLPPPPTQADAEAVRESMRGAFARGTIRSEASAAAQVCSPPCPRMPHRHNARACACRVAHAWELRSLRHIARACCIARPPSLQPACSGSPSPRADPLRRPRCPRAHPLQAGQHSRIWGGDEARGPGPG